MRGTRLRFLPVLSNRPSHIPFQLVFPRLPGPFWNVLWCRLVCISSLSPSLQALRFDSPPPCSVVCLPSAGVCWLGVTDVTS